MKHRVVLYNPDAVFFTMPLGLLAIGSALDPDRYEVLIIDARLEDDPIATATAAADGALCVGITVLTGQPIRDALRLSRTLKAKYPDLPIIWGGWHPSLFQAECLEESAVDITVAGQGEETFADIADRLSRDENLEGCEGTAFRHNGEIIVNPPRPLRPLDAFPAHDYSLIPVERYYTLKGKRQLDYISSQGCRFRCAFCADPYVYQRGWVGIEPDRMVREITHLAGTWPFEELAFQDETFFTKANRVEAVCDGLIEADLGVSWTATMRADQGTRLDDALFAKARKSGLRWAMIGVESGSQDMMDWIKKDITIEQVLIAAEKCIRHDIGAIFPFIVGFPGESDESLEATMQMVKRLRKMSPRFETPIFFYRPYPGSPIAEEAERRGYVMPRTLNEWASFDYVETDGMDNIWLNKTRRTLMHRFKFYQRHAYGTHPRLLHRPLQTLARWRCNHDFYNFPIEKTVVERLFPSPQLS